MTLSSALVARKQVRTELAEVSLTVLHQLRWWAREMRLPRALCSFKSPAWCLQWRGSDTNMYKKQGVEELDLSPTVIPEVVLVYAQNTLRCWWEPGWFSLRPPPPPPPTPSFLSVLFHHQLHPRKPKGARVTHRGREGLRWMGGCDFTCQVCQMWMQIHSNDEQWQNFVENVIKWRCLGVHICALQLQKLGQWARESHAEVPSSAPDRGDGENCC